MKKTKIAAIALSLLMACSLLTGCDEDLLNELQDVVNSMGTLDFDDSEDESSAGSNTSGGESAASSDASEADGSANSETSNDESTSHDSSSNTYCERVGEQAYRDALGIIHVIDKIYANKSGTIEGTAIAYDADGAVIGKSTDIITITKGKYNYLEYQFSSATKIDKIGYSIQLVGRYGATNENAVEVETYNRSGETLYITLKQVKDKIDTLAMYKVLFYKDGKLVESEWGYCSSIVTTLKGKGSTAVVDIWTGKLDYDEIEIFIED